MLPNRYKYMLERIAHFANIKNSLGLLVYDEDSKDKVLWSSINNYLFKHPVGRSLNILEMPLFVKSVITPGVQIADLMAGVVRHYYEKRLDSKSPGNEFEEWISTLYFNVSSLALSYPNDRGTTNFGIFIMPKNNY